MNKTLVTTAVAAVLALVAMATVVGSARATYPGATNGRLAFGIRINATPTSTRCFRTGRTCAG